MDEQPMPASATPVGAPPSFSGEIRMALPGDARAPGVAAPSPRPTVVLRTIAGRDQAGMPGFGGSAGNVSVSVWTMIVTALLLLIACANVATLLLARATKREHEIAVRVSLGATSARLVRQLVSESAVLAVLGALGGLLVGALSLRVLPTVLPLPPLPGILDSRLVAFVSGAAVVAVLLFGLAPAVLTARRDLHTVLGRTTRTHSDGATGRNALVVTQLALSLVLLVGAVLFARSLQKVVAIDTGFDVDRVLVARLDERGSRMSEAEVEAFWESAHSRLRALPNVVSTATSAVVPFQMNLVMPVVVSGHPAPDGQPRPTGAEFVGPDYFGTLGIGILQGRGFSANDRSSTTPVAIINTTFSRKYFGGGTVLGQCIAMPEPGRAGPCVRVIGIVEDARYATVTDEPSPFVYRPFAQRPRFGPPGNVLNVRTASDARQLAGRVQRELNSAQVGTAVVTVSSLFDLVAPQLLPWRIGSALFGAFGSIGLLLACVGLYGVMSYVVTLRTRELGVRMALGATPGRVLALVMRGALRLAVAGLALGTVLALFAVRFLERMIYGVRVTDPLAFLGATAVLLATTIGASVIPARRAARINPVEAMRYE